MQYSISSADLYKDRADLMRILRDNLGPRVDSWYSWKYLNCPYGEVRSWILRKAITGVPVGCISLFPRKILIDGEVHTVGVAGDLAVDSTHRLFWPALQLLKKMIDSSFKECAYTALYSVPNEHSEAIVLKTGFKIVGVMKKFVKIQKTEYKQGSFLPPARLTKVLSPIFNTLFKFDLFCKLIPFPSSFTSEITTTPTSGFEKLLQQSKIKKGVAAYRTIDYLQWRFSAHPVMKYNFYTIKNTNGPVACLVYFVENNAVLIADVFYCGSTENAAVLFSNFIRFCKLAGYGSLGIYYMGAELDVILRRLSFLHIKAERTKVILYQNKEEFDYRFLNDESWQFFWADTDI